MKKGKKWHTCNNASSPWDESVTAENSAQQKTGKKAGSLFRSKQPKKSQKCSKTQREREGRAGQQFPFTASPNTRERLHCRVKERERLLECRVKQTGKLLSPSHYIYCFPVFPSILARCLSSLLFSHSFSRVAPFIVFIPLAQAEAGLDLGRAAHRANSHHQILKPMRCSL